MYFTGGEFEDNHSKVIRNSGVVAFMISLPKKRLKKSSEVDISKKE